MNSRLKIPVLAVICLLALATQSFIPKASAEVKNTCSLVTAQDVEAVLGEPVRRPQSESRSTTTLQSSTCRFLGSQSQTKYLSIIVQQVTTDLSASKTAMSDYLRKLNFTNVQPVQGVGDEAAWGSATLAGKLICQLSARKGKSTWLVIMITGLPDDTDTINRAKILANKVLAQV